MRPICNFLSFPMGRSMIYQQIICFVKLTVGIFRIFPQNQLLYTIVMLNVSFEINVG